MNKEDIEICKKVLNALNKMSYQNIGVPESMMITQSIQSFIGLIRKHEELLIPKVVEPPIIMKGKK